VLSRVGPVGLSPGKAPLSAYMQPHMQAASHASICASLQGTRPVGPCTYPHTRLLHALLTRLQDPTLCLEYTSSYMQPRVPHVRVHAAHGRRTFECTSSSCRLLHSSASSAVASLTKCDGWKVSRCPYLRPAGARLSRLSQQRPCAGGRSAQPPRQQQARVSMARKEKHHTPTVSTQHAGHRLEHHHATA